MKWSGNVFVLQKVRENLGTLFKMIIFVKFKKSNDFDLKIVVIIISFCRRNTYCKMLKMVMEVCFQVRGKVRKNQNFLFKHFVAPFEIDVHLICLYCLAE